MGTTYERAPQKVAELAAALMKAHHPELVTAEVTLDILLAHAPVDEETGEVKGPALVRGGYQLAGMCRIVNLRDRTKGLADAEIILDGDQWDGWGTAKQRAVLDHELTHLELKTDDEGHVVGDDLGRPKLKIRQHDYQHGWFVCVADRHGEASVEREQARRVFDEHGQALFPWMDEPADGPDLEAAIERSAPSVADAAKTYVKRVKKTLKPGESLTLTTGGERVTIDGAE